MDNAKTVVFVHAHPDDEAIFTGGTMALLASAGHRVVLVVATSGEMGEPDTEGNDLAAAREKETKTSCEALGIEHIHYLRFGDSGLNAENPNGFAHVDPSEAADQLIAVLNGVGTIDEIVTYDDHGIYGHPDHLQAYRVTQLAASQLEIATLYESTVDREYLHFVETHVVVEAGLGSRPIGRGLAASDLGLPSVLIDITVDVNSRLDAKRQSMAAHVSQLPRDAPAFLLGEKNFAAVYGYEWYVRHGPPGSIDALPRS